NPDFFCKDLFRPSTLHMITDSNLARQMHPCLTMKNRSMSDHTCPALKLMLSQRYICSMYGRFFRSRLYFFILFRRSCVAVLCFFSSCEFCICFVDFFLCRSAFEI